MNQLNSQFEINTLIQFLIFDVFYMFRTVLRMNPWGSKHAEDVKIESKYSFEKCAFNWFMLHKNILTVWPKKTDTPLFDPHQPTV